MYNLRHSAANFVYGCYFFCQINRVWVRLSARPLVLAFQQWRRWLALSDMSEHTHLMHRLGCRILCGGLVRNHANTVRTALVKWRSAVAAVVEAERHERVTRKFVSRLHQNRVLSALLRWVEYRKERVHLRKLVRVCVWE